MIVKATRDQWKSKGFFAVKKGNSLSIIQNVTAQYGTASPRSGTCLEYFKVRGYMEMRFTCNLVDMQMMHGIYMYR